MVKGIDCASKLTARTAAAIRAEGYAFAGRYLVPNSGTLAWKALTGTEAETITKAGLRLLSVWETTVNRAKGGAAAGAADGADARRCAREIGMPKSGVIYFTVDYDAQPGDMDAIEAYLRAARENTGEYETGVYGSYSVIETMAQRKACTGFWQCAAWSYGKKSEHLTVYQSGFGQHVAGVSVDIDECPDMVRAGIWTFGDANGETDEGKEAEMTYYKTIEDVPDYYRAAVQKAVDAGALEGTGDGLNVSEDLCRMLTILDRMGNWSDAEGNALPRCYGTD